MSGVNVLAVLDFAELRARSLDEEADAQEARAVVVDLIRAAEEARSTLQKLVDMDRLPKNSKGLRDLTNVLARIRGDA